jgi:lipopolysaccharide transport system permease protein
MNTNRAEIKAEAGINERNKFPSHSVEQPWSLEIKPTSPWFNINLKDLWDYRDLLILFVRRDIVSVYKQTILGPLWFFISPVFTVITFTFVFNNIAGISTDGIPAPLFYLAGTTLWNYFQTCLTGTSGTFVNNAGIFGKVYFPRLILPLSTVISNLIKFAIQFGLFLIFWAYYYFSGEIKPNVYMLLFPFLLVIMAGISLSSGIIISSLTTKYRDLTYLIAFGVSLLMYATPVIYPVSAIPSEYVGILAWNPIAPLIEAFRYGFTGAGVVSINGLIYSFLFMCITLLGGVALFSKVEKNFMDTV